MFGAVEMIFTIFFSLKYMLRTGAYVALGGLVLLIRHHNRKKRRAELERGTRKMMRETPKDENGKYPWER